MTARFVVLRPARRGRGARAWLDERQWTSLIDAEPELAPAAEGFIRVRAAVSPERIAALELADVRRSPHAAVLAPAEALLCVAVPDQD